MAKTLYIIDGHSQIYRAYYAPFRDLTSPTGEPTRATYVFSSMLLKLLADKRPDYLAMAVDGPAEKLRRRKVFTEYKVTRKPMPDDLPPQVARILEIVETMGIPILRAEGYEADDLIATAARRFGETGLRVVVVSRDKDLDQLVTDNVVLYDPMKDQILDAAAIAAEKGYTPDKAVEVQALMGDAIDNIPGIPGVGPKTAVRLIEQYGSADGVLAHADEQTPKLRENLLKHAANIPLARTLATLDRNVEIDLDLESMRFDGVRVEAVRPVFKELGFNRLLDQLDKLAPGGDAPAVPPRSAVAPPTGFVGGLFGTLPMTAAQPVFPTAAAGAAAGMKTAADYDYRLIDTREGVEALAKELAGVKRLAVDTETTSTAPMTCELVGLSLAWRSGHGVYVPVKGPLGSAVVSVEDVRRLLGPILADESVEKVGQNLKYDMLVLANAGIEIRGRLFDTMIAACVLDSTRASLKLDNLAAEFLNHRCIPIEDLIGRGKGQITMNAVPTSAVAIYAAEDADVSLRLADVLAGQLDAQGLRRLFDDQEMPLLPVLADMERAGVIVDPAALRRMEVDLSKQADVLRDRILAAAGRPFNVDSPRQLAEVLFKDLGLTPGRATKTGLSTDSQVLEQLAVEHELPALVLDYRRLTKLIGTYLTSLAGCIHPRTGRVHTIFHQAGTATGRLSSSDPNLQNIPVRSEEGRQIRSAFVAGEGNLLLSADYSQVELRILAHLCQDPTLVAAFQADQDIHRIVAAEVFGVPVDAVTPQQRAKAKTVNFGIIYGQTAFGLSVSLRIPRGEAAEFIRQYHRRFPRIEEFLQACIAAAKRQGYVETLFGWRRRISDIESSNPQRRGLAERLAINSVVQGSAADLIKRAMVNIAARIRREGRPAKMLLQIHDELLFEIPRQTIEADRKMIVEEMSSAIALRVPLKVDAGVGANWLEAK